MKLVLKNSSIVFQTMKPIVNLLDPNAILPGNIQSGVRKNTSRFDYFITDYIPVSQDGLIMASQPSIAESLPTIEVFDSSKNYIRSLYETQQYTYVSGDAYAVFVGHHGTNGSITIEQQKEYAATIAIVEGTEYHYVPYSSNS